MRVLAAIGAVALLAGVAAADDKVLVLKSEGRADKKVRTKIEGAVLKLAQGTGESTTAGDITYGDAAAMVGCKPEDDKCKDEVIGMLAVDEIVTITATPKPGGVEVAVRRIGKGGVTKSASGLIAPEKLDQLEPIAPLFGKDAPLSPLPPPVTPTPAVTTTPPPREPIVTPTPTPTPTPTAPNPEIPPPTRVAEPTPTAPMQTPPPQEPRDDDHPHGARRLEVIGMVGGGALVIVGAIFWASAKQVENEIADAPKRTRDDLRKLQDLEDKGDAYATAGNVLAVTGLVVGGVSTYFFIRGRTHSSQTARVTPMVLGNGAGLAVTWGGSP